MQPFSRRILFVALISFVANQLAFALTSRYRATWRDDPSTTIVIGWDQVSGINPVFYYDVVDHADCVEDYSYAKHPDRSIYAKGMHNHFVRLAGLRPNTRYFFVITDSEGVNQRFSFRTIPDHADERISIVAGGDSRNHLEARRAANRMVAKLRPHFVLFGGDMTGGDSSREWLVWMDDWQLTTCSDGRLTPIVPARGNHEYSNATITDLFDIKSLDVYYSLTFGGNLFRTYTLNSLIPPGGEQRKWLEEDLKSQQEVIYKLAQYHYPIRPHTRVKRNRDGQWQHWAGLFHDYRFDLVIESDGHVVKSSYPIRPDTGPGSDEGFIRDDFNGTVYIGEGCWGAPLRRNNDDKNWTRSSGSFNQFKWIFIDKQSIEVRTIHTDNVDQVAEVDHFNIFLPPNGLKLWNPPSGDIITLHNRNAEPVLVNNPPVEPLMNLTDCSAELAGNRAFIHWKTLNEWPNLTYEIQRSHDGIHFTTIASIEGRGQIQKTNIYKVLDRNLSDSDPDKLQYRIKRLLPNGHYSFFKAVPVRTMVARAGSNDFAELYPDPNTGLLKVKYKLKTPGNVSIRLFNNFEKEVSKSYYQNQREGNYLKSIDMKSMPHGDYLLVIKTEEEIISQIRIIKKV